MDLRKFQTYLSRELKKRKQIRKNVKILGNFI